MGMYVWNIQQIKDYTTKDECLRLHLDLPLSKQQSGKLRELLTSGDKAGALAMVKGLARPETHLSIEAVFDSLTP